MNVKMISRLLCVAALALMLSACGGGGSDSRVDHGGAGGVVGGGGSGSAPQPGTLQFDSLQAIATARRSDPLNPALVR